VDWNEKKRLRDRIGEHLDVSNARLTDDEASFLGNFVDEYDEKHRGRTETRTTSHDGWSSDFAALGERSSGGSTIEY
jgi:hypothetical protein